MGEALRQGVQRLWQGRGGLDQLLQGRDNVFVCFLAGGGRGELLGFWDVGCVCVLCKGGSIQLSKSGTLGVLRLGSALLYSLFCFCGPSVEWDDEKRRKIKRRCTFLFLFVCDSITIDTCIVYEQLTGAF